MIGYNYHRTQRTASEPFALPGSVNWWSTIRSNVIKFSGLAGSVSMGTTSTPVITYISRQDWGRRMLIPEHHEELVRELYGLRDQYEYDANVVSMDKLSRTEQLRLGARTTVRFTKTSPSQFFSWRLRIMMVVHGNGLTALIWMKPSPRSNLLSRRVRRRL